MKLLSSFLLVLLLVGCGQTKYIIIEEKKVIDVPKTLFIYPETPELTVSKEEYVNLTSVNKEVVLAEYLLDLQKIIVSYNIILKNVERYIDEHKEIVERIVRESKNARPS